MIALAHEARRLFLTGGLFWGTLSGSAAPSGQYVGAAACAECHREVHNKVRNTPHTRAFETLKNVHADKKASCLPCHTVGYQLPTGFVSETATPHLAGVQCESCHGPSGNHAANPFDPINRPRASLAASICGTCHNAEAVPAEALSFHRPYHEEWRASGHRAVTASLIDDFTNSVNSVANCGRCHSGSARDALIKNDPLPFGQQALVGIACATCHDPHQKQIWTNVLTGARYTNQLRQAITSTNDFFLTTSDNFQAKYNPHINICAQCHNHRGAAWTETARAPHHSPQYNILLGTVGVLPTGTRSGPAGHAGTRFLADRAGRLFGVTNQCVSCHVQKTEFRAGPPQIAPGGGHRFDVTTYESCAGCHGTAANAQGLVVFTSGVISNWIQQVKQVLDTWAATKAPPGLYTTYGTRAWEYTTPGDLSPGGPGPSSAEQGLIPDNIKKARFNLYLVLYDGSFGTHNGPHATTLLESAQNWVQEELSR